MTTTLTAPSRMRRREHVADVIGDTDDLTDAVVVLALPRDQQPTASFVDEFVRYVLIDRGASSLTFRGAGEVSRILISASAARWEVADRVTIEPAISS